MVTSLYILAVSHWMGYYIFVSSWRIVCDSYFEKFVRLNLLWKTSVTSRDGLKKPRGWMRQVREIDCISIVFYSLAVHYKKSFDLWRNSHDVFKFRHKSHCIQDKLSNFVTDWQCWTWSPIWSPNTGVVPISSQISSQIIMHPWQ
jgi:hypothetical protein